MKWWNLHHFPRTSALEFCSPTPGGWCAPHTLGSVTASACNAQGSSDPRGMRRAGTTRTHLERRARTVRPASGRVTGAVLFGRPGHDAGWSGARRCFQAASLSPPVGQLESDRIRPCRVARTLVGPGGAAPSDRRPFKNRLLRKISAMCKDSLKIQGSLKVKHPGQEETP